jgi:superfamily II DNA/RNA helicase
VLHTTVPGRIADLAAFLRAERPFQTLLFCGTRHETEEVQQAIAELGLEAEFLHGELSANRRRQLVERFRGGDLPVLVASDLAARGLDLPGVDLVVNYSLPPGVHEYLHRAGRTGRAGRPGTVVSMLIGQQHDRFEKLKAVFAFESVEVVRGRVVVHKAKTREERDLEFRQLPRVKPKPDHIPLLQRPVAERRPRREERSAKEARPVKPGERGLDRSRRGPRRNEVRREALQAAQAKKGAKKGPKRGRKGPGPSRP